MQDLLEETNYPSLSRLVIKTIALGTWKAVRIRIGLGGSLGPVGELLCPWAEAAATTTVATGRAPATGAVAAGAVPATGRQTRAEAAGLLQPPTRMAVRSFVWEARNIWNRIPDHRTASTSAAARLAINDYAKEAPI